MFKGFFLHHVFVYPGILDSKKQIFDFKWVFDVDCTRRQFDKHLIMEFDLA